MWCIFYHEGHGGFSRRSRRFFVVVDWCGARRRFTWVGFFTRMTRIIRIFTDLFLGFCGVFFTTKGTEGFHEGREGFLWWWIGVGHEGVSLGWFFLHG